MLTCFSPSRKGGAMCHGFSTGVSVPRLIGTAMIQNTTQSLWTDNQSQLVIGGRGFVNCSWVADAIVELFALSFSQQRHSTGQCCMLRPWFRPVKKVACASRRDDNVGMLRLAIAEECRDLGVDLVSLKQNVDTT